MALRDGIRFARLLLGTLVFLSTGCRPSSHTDSTTDRGSVRHTQTAAIIVRSPADVVTLLNEAHLSRDYDRMSPYILVDQQDATISFLKAVDHVLDQNARLRQTASRRFGEARADVWTLGDMTDNLGVFSAHIDVINQTFEGQRAQVTLQEADHVPLIHVQFQKEQGLWRFRPEPNPQAILKELDQLAQRLDEITRSIEQGAEFEEYVESFPNRILPQMNRVLLASDRSMTSRAEVIQSP